MKEWLDQSGYHAARFRWWIEYACRDDFGADLSQTSAWAGLHYFVSRLSPGEDEAAEFLTWPEGNGRLVDVMARRAGGRIRTGRMVTEIHPGKDDVLIRGFDAFQKPFAIRARTAVCALPRPFAERVVRSDDRALVVDDIHVRLAAVHDRFHEGVDLRMEGKVRKRVADLCLTYALIRFL